MLLVLPLLLYLGFWQLDRAGQKQVMFDRFGAAEDALDFNDVADQSPESLRYRKVRLRGRYLPERQFLLEGMFHESRPGLHVLTPLQLADGAGIVLVNRGWIPETLTRETRPDLSVAGSWGDIQGRVVPYPQPGMRLGGEPEEGWPQRVVYPTPAEIAAALQTEILPHLIWLDSAAADGFVRAWKPAEFGPARHIGYAVQWFALAFTLILLYIIFKFRRHDD
ncbi:MAG: SURF1 family protein [Gammaproteobacteria bacterium]|nr:SURF1 family protein [Gammaproteobacteria bacterium]NNF62250.1 SURF1 family protein [Gammaproteobacteria bacterium]NNM21047.1 SURF1 family protein [Gammaproteobacteria bacterium]